MKNIYLSLICILFIFMVGCDQNSTISAQPKIPEKGVKIIESTVSYKGQRSTGSVQANWKIHLKNESSQSIRGQLWFYGNDKDGFEYYENLLEVMTIIPANGEIKKIHELYFDPGEFDRLKTYRTIWKQIGR